MSRVYAQVCQVIVRVTAAIGPFFWSTDESSSSTSSSSSYTYWRQLCDASLASETRDVVVDSQQEEKSLSQLTVSLSHAHINIPFLALGVLLFNALLEWHIALSFSSNMKTLWDTQSLVFQETRRDCDSDVESSGVQFLLNAMTRAGSQSASGNVSVRVRVRVRERGKKTVEMKWLLMQMCKNRSSCLSFSYSSTHTHFSSLSLPFCQFFFLLLTLSFTYTHTHTHTHTYTITHSFTRVAHCVEETLKIPDKTAEAGEKRGRRAMNQNKNNCVNHSSGARNEENGRRMGTSITSNERERKKEKEEQELVKSGTTKNRHALKQVIRWVRKNGKVQVQFKSHELSIFCCNTTLFTSFFPLENEETTKLVTGLTDSTRNARISELKR